MVLPKGWDSELKTLEEEVAKAAERRDAVIAERDEEIERIMRSYENKIPYVDSGRVRKRKERILKRIRKRFPITHPESKHEFRLYREAAEILAHYWQGRSMAHEELLERIGGSDARTNTEAFDYAEMLTEPGSPERDYVRKAQDFLWRDVGK